MTSSYRRLAVTVLLVNIVSALLFIAVVRGFVYDDSRNVRDVRRYATNGVTVETIRAHLNPTGPTSFIWMAAGARLFSGDEIGGARLAIVMSWVLLGAGVLFAGRRSDFPELWYASLLITLIYPHTMIATATMMTEGPALLLAVLGALAWLSSISAPHVDARGAGLMAIGGLALGLAITSRQYYIALVPAAAAVAALQIWKRPDPERGARIATAAASLVLATIPIVLLTIIWKGLSSPAIASGVAYARWEVLSRDQSCSAGDRCFRYSRLAHTSHIPGDVATAILQALARPVRLVGDRGASGTFPRDIGATGAVALP